MPKGVLTQGLWGSYFLPRLGLRGSYVAILAQGLAQDLAPDLVQDLAQDLAQDLVQDLAQDLVHDLAQDLVQDLVQDLAQDLAQDRGKNTGDSAPGKPGRALWQTEITGGLCGIKPNMGTWVLWWSWTRTLWEPILDGQIWQSRFFLLWEGLVGPGPRGAWSLWGAGPGPYGTWGLWDLELVGGEVEFDDLPPSAAARQKSPRENQPG